MKCLLAIFRAALFYVGFVALTVSASIITCLLFFLPFKLLQRIATTGNYLVMQWLRLTCNIKIVVSGTENIPSGACVILSNHQSKDRGWYNCKVIHLNRHPEKEAMDNVSRNFH